MNWINWKDDIYNRNDKFVGFGIQQSIQNKIKAQQFIHYYRITSLELSSKKEIRSINSIDRNSKGYVNHVQLDKNYSRFLLAGSNDGKISLYDLESVNRSRNNDNFNIINPKRVRKSLKPRTTNNSQNLSTLITNLDWYPNDNGLFLACQRRGFVQLWDTEEFEVAADCEINTEYINYACFNKLISFGGPLIAIASKNRSIYLYDPNTGDKSHELNGHTDEVNTIDWSPTSPYQLCSGSADKSIKFWDIRKGNHHGLLLTLDWRQDHTKVHSSQSNSYVEQNSNSLRYVRKINWSNEEACIAHEDSVKDIKYTSCGKYIISSGNDKKIRLWNVTSGKLIPINYSIGRKSDISLGFEIASFNHSSDDLLLYSTGKFGNISIIPVHSNDGEPIHTLKGHLSKVSSITYSKQYQQIISSGRDGMIHLWECNSNPRICSQSNNHLTRRRNSINEDCDNWSEDNTEDSSTIIHDKKKVEKNIVSKLYMPPIIQSFVNDINDTNDNIIVNDINLIPDKSKTKEDKILEDMINSKRIRLAIGINHIKSKYSKK